MSVGDYQNFNLDLRDTGCVEEVIDAIVQRKIDYYQDIISEYQKEINDVYIHNGGLIQDCENMNLRIRDLEDELVKERQGKYEN